MPALFKTTLNLEETVGFRLDAHEHELVVAEAKRQGMTKTQFFRMLVSGYLAFRAGATINNNKNGETSVF